MLCRFINSCPDYTGEAAAGSDVTDNTQVIAHGYFGAGDKVSGLDIEASKVVQFRHAYAQRTATSEQIRG